MIATGTDIKPVEIVVFLRSREEPQLLRADEGPRRAHHRARRPARRESRRARVKDHFVIVDAVGVCERDKTDSRPMDRRRPCPSTSCCRPWRWATSNPKCSPASPRAWPGWNATSAMRQSQSHRSQRRPRPERPGARHRRGAIRPLPRGLGRGGGRPVRLVEALMQAPSNPSPTPPCATSSSNSASRPTRSSTSSRKTTLIEAGFRRRHRAREKPGATFEAFIAEHRDEITALQILYNRPVKAPLSSRTSRPWPTPCTRRRTCSTESALWQAYAALDKSKVKGGSRRRILTDLVSLVRFAMHQENELVPYPERVAANFKAWLAQQQSRPACRPGRAVSIPLHPRTTTLAGNDPRPHRRQPRHQIDDFEYAPFNQEGGLGACISFSASNCRR
jgi:type I restriction enzyme R subunit